MKKKTLAAVIILLLGAGVVTALFLILSRVERNYVLEAGDTLNVKQLLVRESSRELCFEDGTTEFYGALPGIYTLKVKLSPFMHTVTVTVTDTIPPQAEVVERVTQPYGEACAASEFVRNIKDATNVVVEYINEPDFSQWGIQQVQICLTDDGQNATHMTAELLIPKVDIKNPYIMEAGAELPNPQDLLLESGTIDYASSRQSVNTEVPGIYPMQVVVDNEVCDILISVTDTVPPEVTLSPKQWYLGADMMPEQFVDSAKDATELTYAFIAEPDMSKEGEQQVKISVTDAGGNMVSKETTLTLIPDVEAPIILGVGNLSTQVGGVISYRTGISATDNCDGEVAVTIDNSAVDLNAIGTYPVIYTATDRFGNVASQEVKVTVMPEHLMTYSLEDMYALADAVLLKIITDDMTEYQKAEAIYNWTKGNISFIDDSVKEDWVEAAYNGFTYHKGDCYTYACVAKALLTRAGIPNVDIKRKSVTSKHFWNLVDVGDGWYHFDATPRIDKTRVFMWSETQLTSDPAVNRSHVYDRSLYPTVEAE